MKFIKRFAEWIAMKIEVDSNTAQPPLFKQREIWWCTTGENVGCEISGKGLQFRRPVLIIRKLDSYSFIGIPLTKTRRLGNWYFPIKVKDAPNTVILCQPRHFDYRRLNSKLWILSEPEFEKIVRCFVDLFLK